MEMSNEDHMNTAWAMRAEQKWADVRAHVMMTLLTDKNVEKAYLLLAEAEWNLGRYEAASMHLEWHLASSPNCAEGLQLRGALAPFLKGPADDGDAESHAAEAQVPMSTLEAKAASREIMSRPSALELAARQIGDLAAFPAASQGGLRHPQIEIEIPISASLQPLLAKCKVVSLKPDSVVFESSNGKAHKCLLKAIQKVQPAGTFRARVPERQSLLDRLPDHLRKELQIPKQSFARLVREMVIDLAKEMELEVQHKLHHLALLCLQESAETFCCELFALCQVLANHGKRKTIMVNDLTVVLHLQQHKLLPS